MRRSLLGISLLLILPFLSGCIDLAMRYLVREDGSLRVTYDVVMEKSMLQMIYSMTDSTQSPALADTTDSGLFGSSSKPFKMTKAVADSIRSRMFGKEIARLQALPQVTSVSSRDSLGYDGVHFLFTTELRSYKDLSLLRNRDSAHSINHFQMGDSVFVKEQGDSILFQIADLSGIADRSKLKDLPMFHRMDGMFKKTRFHRLAMPHPSLFHSALYHPAIDTPSVEQYEDSLQVDPDDSDDDSADGDDSGSAADSLMRGMQAFGNLLSGLMTMELSVESPLLLSHDPAATFDAETNTATWHMDLTSFMALEDKSKDELKYYVWLRKPKAH